MSSKGMGNSAWFLAMAIVLAMTPVVTADDYGTDKQKPAADKGAMSDASGDATECVRQATAALEAATNGKEPGIPSVVLEKSMGVAVIPQSSKSAGKGLVSRRTDDGEWSAPAFVSISGAGEWTKAGDGSRDLVVVFTDEASLDRLVSSSVTLASATSTPSSEASGMAPKPGTSASLDPSNRAMDGRAGSSTIYTYSRGDGAFTRVTLANAVLDIDDAANTKVYGKDASAEAILSGGVNANGTTQPFVKAIEQRLPEREA